MCVWYSIANSDSITQIPIKGEIEEIQREGRTEVLFSIYYKVIVNEGNQYLSYGLDEGLIGFGIALEDKNLIGAVNVLEGLEINQETENMWKQLMDVCLKIIFRLLMN